jgi:hypothetical protein
MHIELDVGKGPACRQIFVFIFIRQFKITGSPALRTERGVRAPTPGGVTGVPVGAFVGADAPFRDRHNMRGNTFANPHFRTDLSRASTAPAPTTASSTTNVYVLTGPD